MTLATVKAIILCLAIAIITSCNAGDENIDFSQTGIEVRDTIPNAISEIPGEYVVNFREYLIDSLENLIQFFQFEQFQEDKTNASLFLNRVFSDLRLKSESLISINPYRFVAKLDSGQIRMLNKNNRVHPVEHDYLIRTYFNVASSITLATENVCWGTTRVTNSIKSNAVYSHKIWVLDSGVDPNHEELNVNKVLSTSYYPGTNYYDVQGKGNDHGTQVAGVIGASKNGKGIVGVSPNAEIVGVKFIDKGDFRNSYYLDALSYANEKAQKGDVVNLSIQNTPGTAAEQYLISQMAAKGIFVVIAAGNYGSNVDDADVYPAKINADNIYTVSSFKEGDIFSEFSNYGSSVDIGAPGEVILTTLPGNAYGVNKGTSFSAPYISGLLLLKGKLNYDGKVKGDPDANKDQVGHE